MLQELILAWINIVWLTFSGYCILKFFLSKNVKAVDNRLIFINIQNSAACVNKLCSQGYVGSNVTKEMCYMMN